MPKPRRKQQGNTRAFTRSFEKHLLAGQWPVYLRGVSKRYYLATLQSARSRKADLDASRGRPAFYISPTISANARNFMSRLHASIFTSVRYAYVMDGFATYQNPPARTLPVLVFFKPRQPEESSSFGKPLGENPYQYEWALVHGKKRTPFTEHRNAIRRSRVGARLFEVRLTKKEYAIAREKASSKLGLTGENLPFEGGNHYKIVDAILEEASRLLTNKAVQKAREHGLLPKRKAKK